MGNATDDEVVSFAKASLCQTFLFLAKIGFLLNSYTSTTEGQILQIFNTKHHAFCSTSLYITLFKKYLSFKLQTPQITSSKPLIQQICTEQKLRSLSHICSSLHISKLEHIWKHSCLWDFTFNFKQLYIKLFTRKETTKPSMLHHLCPHLKEQQEKNHPLNTNTKHLKMGNKFQSTGETRTQI